MYRGSAAIRLSRRELELVLYLASRWRACSGEEIVDALWPNRCKSDTTILRVTVLRTRSRLGDSTIIRSSNGSYRLADDVSVDVREMEELVSCSRSPIDLETRERLRRCVERLMHEPPIRGLHECFASVVLRIAELRHRLAMVLARDALERCDCDAALEVLSLLVAFDPYDEPARELRIQAYMARGDRASAIREFRVYRDLLAAQLGARPSMELEALLATA